MSSGGAPGAPGAAAVAPPSGNPHPARAPVPMRFPQGGRGCGVSTPSGTATQPKPSSRPPTLTYQLRLPLCTFRSCAKIQLPKSRCTAAPISLMSNWLHLYTDPHAARHFCTGLRRGGVWMYYHCDFVVVCIMLLMGVVFFIILKYSSPLTILPFVPLLQSLVRGTSSWQQNQSRWQ